jgi:two-component system, OmpR family, sensor kinase
MSAGREAGRQRPRASWLAGRTLSARLITGVLLLLVGACAIIGVVTYLAVRDSMVSTLDGQLSSASSTYASCIENTGQGATDQGEPPGQPGSPDNYQPPPNNSDCSQGQPQGMLGVRIKNGVITNCSVVNGMNNQRCPPLSASDKKALMALPVYQPPYQQGTDQQPWSNTAHSVRLTSLDADYRVTAVAGHDGDILITGLPMSTVESTLNQVALAELIVFLSVLLLAGVLGTALIRLSLRPLRRVAATAARVAELPLDSGEVSLPAGVPDSDPRTEVGRVGAAFNRMLYHVERALGRRAASEARLRRFAADASHELRTPLSAIRGYAELALRHPGPVPEDVTHALRRVQSESARMGVLVDDLLLLARLDAGRPLEREPVDLSRLVIDVTSDARVARSDHRWQLDLPDEPVLVEGDEHRLHQVMANLLSNAGKHTPAGSTVGVTLAVPGDPQAPHEARGPGDATVQRGAMPAGPRVELSITDDGPGIPPELLPDLFERFTRADTSRARDLEAAGKSTGLGLAIVDAVVAAHGGSISVTSRPGMTRFAIFLPLLPEPAEAPQASAV